jgi:hypothetical protein
MPVPYSFTSVFSGSFLVMFVIFFAIVGFFEYKQLLSISKGKVYYGILAAIVLFYVFFMSFWLFGPDAPSYPNETPGY